MRAKRLLRRHRLLRGHHRDNRASTVLTKIRIALQIFEAPRWRNRVAVRAHYGKMPGQRLGGIRNRFLESVTGGNAAGRIRGNSRHRTCLRPYAREQDSLVRCSSRLLQARLTIYRATPTSSLQTLTAPPPMAARARHAECAAA